MSNLWKEQFDSEFTREDKDDPYYSNVFEDPETITDFISTEIIEKLIADIPGMDGNYGGNWNSNDLHDLKQQLRDKWL